MAGLGYGGGTEVIQVTNVSLGASSAQMRTLFGFLGRIDELRLFPPDGSPLLVSSRVCFVKFHDPNSVAVAQYLTNTIFIDRALIVVPYAEGVIPDETKALSVMAPANAVAGLLPGGRLLRAPHPFTQIGAVPLAAFRAPSLGPALATFGPPGGNLNSQALAVNQLLRIFRTVDGKVNRASAGLVPPSLKSDTSNKERGEAVKRVKAQSIPSTTFKPEVKEEKIRKSRSRSHSRRSRSRLQKKSHSVSRGRQREKCSRRRSHSRERGRKTRNASNSSDKKKEDKEKQHSKIPPKRYSRARCSRSASRTRKQRNCRGTMSPKNPRYPKRELSHFRPHRDIKRRRVEMKENHQ